MGFGLLPSGPQTGTVDRMPGIRPAGLAPGNPEETMAKVMHGAKQPPPTPDPMRRWRRDFEPGKSAPPPGSANDTDYQRLNTYGRVETRVAGESVAEIMNVVPKSDLLERQVRPILRGRWPRGRSSGAPGGPTQTRRDHWPAPRTPGRTRGAHAACALPTRGRLPI